MNYKIWNKLDNINGVDANYVINSKNIKEQDEIFLIENEYGKVEEIQFVDIIKANYKMDISLNAEQVAQEYLRLKVLEEEQIEKEQITLEQQAIKISNLEDEKNSLKQELSITQEAVNELLFSTLNA